MGGIKKKIDGPVQLGDALTESLVRLGQTVRARNSAKLGGGNTGQAELLLGDAAPIEDQVNALKERQRAGTRTATPTTDNQAKGGLVRIRHPNRDFFLADLFDYALKDDGASTDGMTRTDLLPSRLFHSQILKSGLVARVKIGASMLAPSSFKA